MAPASTEWTPGWFRQAAPATGVIGAAQSKMESGVTEPFDTWYAREHPRPVATLLLTTGDLELATEGVDEAFARAVAGWGRVGAMPSPTGWVFTVALNHCRRSTRRRQMERRLLGRRATTPVVPPPAGEIWQLVSVLARRRREVVVLRHVADLREAEIAEVLSISRSTVSSTPAAAHHTLNRLLDDDRTDDHLGWWARPGCPWATAPTTTGPTTTHDDRRSRCPSCNDWPVRCSSGPWSTDQRSASSADGRAVGESGTPVGGQA